MRIVTPVGPQKKERLHSAVLNCRFSTLTTEQTTIDSNEECVITVTCNCSMVPMTLKLLRYTWQYSNNFSFLREAEPIKLQNCSHLLNVSTKKIS